MNNLKLKKYISNNKTANRIVKTILIAVVFTVFAVNAVFADWVKENNRYKFFDTMTGQYVINNWIQTGGGYYYLDAAGYVVVGWYVINGKYYYFDANGLMQVGFQQIGNETYYLEPTTGQMVTGWIQLYNNGVVDYYYFDEVNGNMAKGWKKIGDKWYYFNEGKCIVGTFAMVNEVWYHFNNEGAMDTGWVNSNGKMYFFNLGNGSLTRGWIQDQYGNEYYCKIKGQYRTASASTCSSFVKNAETRSAESNSYHRSGTSGSYHPSGCYITTICCEILGYPDNCSILTSLSSQSNPKTKV